MRKHIATAVQHPLISGTGIIFLGSFLGSFIHFLFRVFMSRNLSPEEYGVLASIFSLTMIPSILFGWITPTVIHFAASYFARGEYQKAKGLFLQVSKIVFLLGIAAVGIIYLFRSNIAEFFKIQDERLLLIGALTVHVSAISLVTASLLQAKLAFLHVTITNLLSAIIKLVFGVGFILLGFKVGGAMWALLLSSVFPYLYTFFPLRSLFRVRAEVPHKGFQNLVSYGLPATIALYGLSAFVSNDILLVKHFFDPKSAGIYSGLSLVGMVIYFFSAPIAHVMFPLVTQRFAKKQGYKSLFQLSLLIVSFFSLSFIIVYSLFPTFVIQFFLKNDEYLAVIPHLTLFGIYIGMYSLLVILVNYFLSIRYTKVYIPIILGAITQGVLIWFFHSSFTEIILISIAIIFVLSLILFFYYLRDNEKK